MSEEQTSYEITKDLTQINLPKLGISLLKELIEKSEKELKVLMDEAKMLYSNPITRMLELEDEINDLNKKILKIQNLTNEANSKEQIKDLKRERFFKQDEYNKIDKAYDKLLKKKINKKDNELHVYRQDLNNTIIAFKQIVDILSSKK